MRKRVFSWLFSLSWPSNAQHSTSSSTRSWFEFKEPHASVTPKISRPYKWISTLGAQMRRAYNNSFSILFPAIRLGHFECVSHHISAKTCRSFGCNPMAALKHIQFPLSATKAHIFHCIEACKTTPNQVVLSPSAHIHHVEESISLSVEEGLDRCC